MKKNLFILAAAAMLAAVSCQEEIAAPEIDSTNEGAFTITASVGVETKTVLGENGKSSYWAKGDKISVFDSKKEANNRCFKIVEEGVDFSKDQKTATFGSDEEFTWPQNNQEDPLIVSLYPYQPAAYCDFFYYDRNYITGLNIPVEQTAVAGGFDSSATFALATGKYSTKDDLKFTNLYSLLKVSVVEENVKTITVTIGENEYIAGEAKVQLNLVVENEVAEFKGGALTASGSNSVTLKCEEGFEVGETYYIAVAPVTYTSISVALNGKVVKSATVTKTLQANTIYSVLGIDDPATVADGVYLNESGVYEISNEAGLFWLAEQVAGGETFDGKTVMLTDDIEMTQAWTPIGNLDKGVNFSFRGTFDGNDKTISNLEVESAECAGFFGAKWDGDVKNVKFDNATVSGNHYAGVVAAWTDGANYNYKFTISGCEITNSTVTLEAEQTAEGWDNGDKAGAVVGYAYAIVVTDNTVSNTMITGYRDLGGVVGCAISNKSGSYAEVKNNNVGENVKVIVDNTHNYKNFTSSSKYNVASHCGRIDNVDGVNNIVSDNTGEATLVTPKERNLNYSNDKAEVVLGDADPDLPVLNGEKDGVEYSSENTDVATVDADGKVTIKKAGTTTITATAPETETYLAGTASYTLTVKEPTYYIYVKNDMGWESVYLHSWEEGEVDVDITTWPGIKLTEENKIGEYEYTRYTLPSKYNNTEIGLLFNNGYGKQLADYTITINENIYLRLTPAGPVKIDPNDVTTFGYKIYIYDQNDIGGAKMHRWGSKASDTQWDGKELTESVDYNYKKLYYFTIDKQEYTNGFNFLLTVNQDDGKTGDKTWSKSNGDLYFGYYNNSSKGFWDMNVNDL